MRIIVARYNESINWTKDLKNVIIYNKGKDNLHRRRFKMRNQSVYDRIDYSMKSFAFQEQNSLKIKYYNIITMNSKRPIMTCSCSSCFSLIRRVFR